MSKRDRYAQQLGEEPPSGPIPGISDIFPATPAPIPPRRGGLVLKDGEVQIGAFTLTGTGLQIGANATQDEWWKVGELLIKLEGSIQWLIGDWLAYGEDVKWGDIPAIAQRLGREEQTLHDCSYVARNVQFSVRTEKLSFTHHKLVAAIKDIDDQRAVLEYAARHALSVTDFRKWLNGNYKKYRALPSQADWPTLPDERSLKRLYRRVKGDASRLKPEERSQMELYIRQVREHADRMENWLKRASS